MVVNVAQLLKADIGTCRTVVVDEVIQPFDESSKAVSPLRGTAQLIRTNVGILVTGRFTISAELECSRCLDLSVEPVTIEFAELFVPIVDVATGAPTHLPRDDQSFIINEKHELDLDPAIREYGLLALPMKPLCRIDCAGLCPRCGVNRNRESCDCVINEPDERFAVLRTLLNNGYHQN